MNFSTVRFLLSRSAAIYYDRTGHLKKASCYHAFCRFIPQFANNQDARIAKFFQAALRSNQSKKVVECCLLFQEKILNKPRLLKSRRFCRAKASLIQELQVNQLAKTLHISSKLLRKHPEFVQFATRNHFHHRIDRHYRKNGLGIRFNSEANTFELPFRCKRGQPIWKDWKSIPMDKNRKIEGYDLLAYGWEKHSNATWRKFKPFKIISKEDFRARFPDQINAPHSPCIELVTTRPTFKKPPGQYGHVYINFYVPQKDGKIKMYSIGYDLTDISTPDVLEFIDRKRVTSLRPISQEQWKSAKKFIEEVQKIHIKKRTNKSFTHPNKKAMLFYKRHMRKNCGNFAVALFEDLTGIQNLYTLFPIMRVIFPKPFHYVSDWLEERLPAFLARSIQKMNIVARGVIPWRLIPQQEKLSKVIV